MSFRNKASVSMLATRERQHSHRLARIPKYQARVLPVAALYGGNASGKTNLLAALFFAKRFIVSGTHPEARIPVQPFLLDSDSIHQPTWFSFELLINETIYEFSFATNDKEVISEKLVELSSTSEKDLYTRQNGDIVFSRSLEKDQFLRFAFAGTRDNELFLTNAVSQKVDLFRPVSNWFRENLKLVSPNTQRAAFFEQDKQFSGYINEFLTQLDTGIAGLDGEDIPFDALPLPDSLMDELRETVKEGQPIGFTGPFGNRYSVSRRDGRLNATKLVALHQRTDGSAARFDIQQESDGSRRAIDLLPFFLEMAASHTGIVCVIDELDRSLHTLLSRALIETYLASCHEESRSQLIFTTHDVQLMDQELFRRDEMWVTERLSKGATRLFSFSEFKDVRKDKDVRKSYLEGRLGGTPHILLSPSLVK